MRRFKEQMEGFIVAVMIMAISITALGADQITNITAQINYSIKVMLNGKAFNPVDTDGTELRPITYNGRTYLPVRAVAEAMDIAVDYDASTSTVILGNSGNSEWTPMDISNLGTALASFTRDPGQLDNGSGVFDNGIIVTSYPVQLNGLEQYSKVKMEAYSIEKGCTITITDFKTKELLKELTVTANTVTPIEIELRGASEITINCKRAELSLSNIILGNVAFK